LQEIDEIKQFMAKEKIANKYLLLESKAFLRNYLSLYDIETGRYKGI